MPTDVLKVSGDYLLDASQGNITLDVTNSISTGTVTILGNLNVVGTTAQIQSVDSTISDNVLIINSGEIANPGITKGTSGILISRGNNNDPLLAASIIYNETVLTGRWTEPPGYEIPGVFEFKSNGKGSAISVNAIRIDVNSTSTLNILGADTGDALITVTGQVDYANRVKLSGDPDAIPNKQYVDEALYAGTDLAKRIQVGNTFVKIADNSVSPLDPQDGQYYGTVNRVYAALGTSTNVVFDLYGTSCQLVGVTIDGTSILANQPTDIVFQPQPGNAVVVKEGLRIAENSAGTISAEPNMNSIYYTGTAGGGGTGLYYVNTQQSDELVSRRKAIIYGIIF